MANQDEQLIINSDLSETLSYAAWQNSVPLLRQLQLRNETETDLQKLTVNLISKPPFVTTKQWKVDELKIGETVEITDRDLEFDADYLRGLNEAERGQIVVTVTSENGEELTRKRTKLESSRTTNGEVAWTGQIYWQLS